MRFQPTPSSSQAAEAAQQPLFVDPEPRRIRIEDAIEWASYCPDCGQRLATRRDKEEARRAGLDALQDHRCSGPGELPEGF